MKTAKISFKNGVAYSDEFEDTYFSVDDPLGESRYVFAQAVDEIWNTKERFIIAEAGFGAGINLLSVFEKFKNSGKFLSYVAIEANPICKQDLKQIYQNLGVDESCYAELLANYPPLIMGFHRINFTNSNITLDLCFGDIDEVLDELDFRADIWFMDGFAPSKNPDMWSERVFSKIANLTQTEGILRTYSSASLVKKALLANGFEVWLKKGFGKKREMIVAKFKNQAKTQKNPWFSRYDEGAIKEPKTALIIGGGVAGCVSAYKLHRLGVDVVIAEKEPDIATNGSKNHCGILMPLITKPQVLLGRMHMNAFLQAVRFYKSTMSDDECEFCGAIDYAHDEKLLERFRAWSEFDTQNGVFELKFDDLPYASAFIKDGARARPRLMCKRASGGIKTLLGCEFVGYETLPDGKISAKFKDGKEITADILILALGSDSMEFFSHFSIPLSSVRGQVTHIEPILQTKPFSAKGYVCPGVDGVQVVGATYDRNLKFDEPKSSDDERNLADVSEFLQGYSPKILSSNVGYRSYSADRFPIISRLHDEKFYKESYKSLFWTKHKGENLVAKYASNVYVSTAHGSRGLCTAVLGAELICDLVFNRPLCIEKSLFNELHSARFLIRKLKKGL